MGLGYSYRGIAHHLAYPGLPLLFAGIFRLLHTQSVVPLLIVMLLMGWAALGLTYRLFLLHSDRPTAAMVTLGLGMTRLFYRYSYELLSDMPFLVAVMAVLVGLESIVFAHGAIQPISPDGLTGFFSSAAWGWRCRCAR